MDMEDKVMAGMTGTLFGAIGLGALYLIVCGVVIPLCGGAGANYSDGERTGVVVKLSRKGVIWKSNEGMMLVGGTSTTSKGATIPATWEFSVTDDAVVAELTKAVEAGKPVRIKYRQWLIGPVQQSTSYTVVAVEPVKD